MFCRHAADLLVRNSQRPGATVTLSVSRPSQPRRGDAHDRRRLSLGLFLPRNPAGSRSEVHDVRAGDVGIAAVGWTAVSRRRSISASGTVCIPARRARRRPKKSSHYEEDFYARLTLGLGNGVRFTPMFTAYTSPNDLFTTVKELASRSRTPADSRHTDSSRSSSAARPMADSDEGTYSSSASDRAGRWRTARRRRPFRSSSA